MSASPAMLCSLTEVFGPVPEEPVKKYYLSSPRFTVQVNTRDNRIVWGAPVITRFMGQPLSNLIRWSQADAVIEIHPEIYDA